MKASLVVLVVAAVGFVAGAWLVGLWLVGLAVMVESVVLAVCVLNSDVPTPLRSPPRPQINTIDDILERHR